MCGPRTAEPRGSPVPTFSFRTQNGDNSSTSIECELADTRAAWAEMTKVCGDLIGGAARKLEQNAKWQIELLDESKQPVFRIRLVAETQ